MRSVWGCLARGSFEEEEKKKKRRAVFESVWASRKPHLDLSVLFHGRCFSGSAFFLLGIASFSCFMLRSSDLSGFYIYHLALILVFFLLFHFYFYCMEHDGMKKQKKSLYGRGNMAITSILGKFTKRGGLYFFVRLSVVVVVVVAVGRHMLYLLLYFGTNCFMYTRYREHRPYWPFGHSLLYMDHLCRVDLFPRC